MKKTLLIILALYGNSFTHAFAQDRLLAGGFKHIIEVGRYVDYGKDYLTITDANGVGLYINGEGRMQYFCYEYPDEYKDINLRLYKGFLILEVDGVSAKGWNKEQFYKTVDGRQDVISLNVQASKDRIFETKIRPLYELPDSVKVFGNSFSSIIGKDGVAKRKTGLTKDVVFEERRDMDFDFFYSDTYDYLLTSDDPLLDKDIINSMQLGGMERNENNPDILFTINRNVDEDIDYYQNSKTVNLSLEIAALDAKRMGSSNTSYRPIVWKATVKRQGNNFSMNFDANKELIALASWMTYPPEDRNVGWAEETLYAPVGISFSNDNPLIIKEVIEGSRAEIVGLLPGDKLIKANLINGNKYRSKSVKQGLKKQGWGIISSYLDESYDITILRNGKKLNVTLRPISRRAYRHYLTGGH